MLNTLEKDIREKLPEVSARNRSRLLSAVVLCALGVVALYLEGYSGDPIEV